MKIFGSFSPFKNFRGFTGFSDAREKKAESTRSLTDSIKLSTERSSVLASQGNSRKISGLSGVIADVESILSTVKEKISGTANLSDLSTIETDIQNVKSTLTGLSDYGTNRILQGANTLLGNALTEIDSLQSSLTPGAAASDATLLAELSDVQTVSANLVASNPGSASITATKSSFAVTDAFDGSGDFQTFSHSSDYMLANGTLELTFNADDTKDAQGLFSKDSMDYDDGGHFTVWIEDDKVYARIQSDTTNYILESGEITAGQDTHVAVSFGDDGFHLYVDGELADSDSYTGGLGTTSGGSGNQEPIVLGASLRQSADQSTSGATDYYTGTLANVNLYHSALTTAEISSLAGVDPDSNSTLLEGHSYSSALDGIDDYEEIAHKSDYLLDNGSFAFEFTADSVSGNQGLISKDSLSYDDGGHIDISLVGDELQFRLQSDSGSYTINGGTVTAGTKHHVVATFGDNGMELYLDGELVGTDSYAGGLGTTSGGSGNENPFAIGARANRSGDNSNTGLQDFLDGTVHNFDIYQGQLSDAEVEGISGGQTLAATQASFSYSSSVEPISDLNTSANNTSGDLSERVQEVYLRISNLLAEDSSAIASYKSNLTTLQASLADHVDPLLKSSSTLSNGLGNIKNTLESVLSVLGSHQEQPADASVESTAAGTIQFEEEKSALTAENLSKYILQDPNLIGHFNFDVNAADKAFLNSLSTQKNEPPAVNRFAKNYLPD